MQIVGTNHLARIIDIEFKIRHDGQLIPQHFIGVIIVATVRKEVVHNADNSGGATISLLAVGNRHTVVNHLLYVPPEFGQNEFLALCIIF